MPEKSWYRKHRPKTMDEYLGDSIKSMVMNRFRNPKDRPSVILIYGERGCGKTTFARIISKYYLCEDPGPNGEPCEKCSSCLSINETLIEGETGVESEGVVEVDSTTASGKDKIQSIVEDAIIPPMYTRYKILIFDECHKISKAAQNSLLKIIEDIPPHLVVIFATTEYNQVIPTIKSRCQLQIEAKKQTVESMVDRLLQIANAEGLKISREACEIIAKRGDRVPRECINILENVAKNHGGTVTYDTVKNELGGLGSDIYVEYITAANMSMGHIMLFIKKLKADNIKATEFIDGLSRFILDSLYIKHGVSIEEYPPEYLKAIQKVFKTYTVRDFDMILQVIEHAVLSMGGSDNKNEVILVTTAMRISKIKLIAEGLGEESSVAAVENKISLQEYYEKHKGVLNIPEPTNVTEGTVADTFDGVRTLKDSGEIRRILMDNAIRADKTEDNSDGDTFSAQEMLSMLSDI